MKRGIVFVSLLFMMAACEVQVKNIYDKNVDFTQYKTFCWMNGCEFDFVGPDYFNDSLVRENMKAVIIAELAEKGLVQDTNNPDLLIGFTVALTDEQAIIFHRPDESQFNIQPLEHDREIVNYLKGSIILGMADRNESRMVWESQAIGYMERRPDFTPEDLRKGIKKVLKNFPPKKNK